MARNPSYSAVPPTRQVVASKAPPTRRRSRWHQIKGNKWAYFFISPFFILFGIFGLFPPLFTLYLSFHKWDVVSPMQWVGLDNYAGVLTDDLFWKAFLNNTVFSLMSTVPGLTLALIIAFLLDLYVHRLRNTFLAAYFSPIITSSVAVAIIFGLMYGTNFGLINSGLRMLGLEPVRWLQDPIPMKFALAILLIWRWLGWNIVLYLVGLQGISHDYYEAARVDGANGVQLFLRITVPLMRPTILYTAIISTIGILQLFAEPYLLTGQTGSMGGTDNSLLTMTGFRHHRNRK